MSDLARDGSDTATARSSVRHGCRFRALPLYLVLALTSIAAFSANAFGAGPPMYTVYGPRSFVRSTGHSSPVSETFTVRSPGSTSTLRIVNHGITSAQVAVNGQVVFEPPDFQGSDKIDPLLMERPVVLRSGANQLTVELQSGPGNHLTIEVVTTDVIAPRISAAANPPANTAGWNNADVTVTFTCADDESGIAACPAPVLVSTEGAQQIVSGTAVDKAGNTAVASLTVNLDKTAPVVTATVSPAANANGWNNGPVVVHFDCADGGSGVPACPADRTVTNDGAGQTVSETATDRAGNSASVTSAAFNIDRTLPAITVALTPAPGGWLKTPVTAHFTCNDAGSGVDTCPPDKTVASEGASQTVTGTVTDRAGNVASVTSDPFDIDVTPPAVTVTLNPPPNAAGWNNTEVTAHFTCADAGSGVIVCPDDQVISTEGAAQTVTGRAFDNAGNTVIGSATVNIDRTGPVLTLSSPTDGSTLFTATATVTGTVADTLSGVAAVTCNDAPATMTQGQVQCDVTLERGAHPILATATDVAGNQSTARLGLSYVRVPQVTISAPSNLGYVSMSPTTVTGTVDDPTATVTVNSIAAPVMNGAFSIVLPLAEGPNVITASANTAEGGVGTASVTVTLDTTPPHVTITSPPDQFVTTEASISIAGSVNDIVVGTVNDQQAQVKLEVSAREFVAQVSNRTFLATAVPLALGPNTILARAIDRVGNSADTHIIVTRRAPTQAQIKLLSGNNQSGTIGATVAAPLVVALTDAAGNPVANEQVIFKVTQNDGLVASGGPPAATVIATTDAQGQARAQWTLGHRAGAGGNAVEAYSVGFDGTALFTATGQQGAGSRCRSRSSRSSSTTATTVCRACRSPSP
ncbi:MAG: hypothetical protein DMF86_04405 [Acidobacteria bacterium]|nr:MAG: hypothetical protein DMF86_04405 [Acidobacteriota bacterium]